MVQRCQHLSFTLEASHAFLVAPKSFGQNFQGHVTLQAGISGAVDLAHPARSNWSKNLVGSKSSSGGKSHDDGFYTTTRFRECDRVLVQGIRNYDIAPDGRHFISVTSGEMQSGTVVV